MFASVITEACKAGFLDENMLKLGCIDFPKIVQKPLEVYNDDEVRTFLAALQEEPPKIRLLLLCALLLGLRRGEIVALKWEDVNLSQRQLTVNHSVYKTKGEAQKLKPPKSRTSVRTVYFSDVLTVSFREWQIAQALERAGAGTGWKEQGYVFTNSVGDMISLYTPSRICSQFEARNGLHHLKLHGLRHTCGSLMMSNGVDAETVKTLLGHESLKTTNLYIHPYEKNLRQAADVLDRLITVQPKEAPI